MLKDMSFFVNVAQVIQAIAISLGIVVGGFWTYRLFICKRLAYPRANLELAVHEALLTEGGRLVHVVVSITNTGDVLLRSDHTELRLRQVVPLPSSLKDTIQIGYDPVPEDKTEIEWPLIASREWRWSKHGFEIEPGESDSLHADFVIQPDIHVGEFYCFISNSKKKRKYLGWALTKLHFFNTNKEFNQMANQKNNHMSPLSEQQRQQKKQAPQQQQQPKKTQNTKKSKKSTS
jgi:hypothetical protein